MIVYSKTAFKPKKKRKPRGEIATKINVAKLSGTGMPSYTLSPRPAAEYARSVQSLKSTANHTSRKESMVYSGTYVKGIAVTHKSNLIPITSQEQAIEVARMRR